MYTIPHDWPGTIINAITEAWHVAHIRSLQRLYASSLRVLVLTLSGIIGVSEVLLAADVTCWFKAKSETTEGEVLSNGKPHCWYHRQAANENHIYSRRSVHRHFQEL